jgi:hypothetical protein
MLSLIPRKRKAKSRDSSYPYLTAASSGASISDIILKGKYSIAACRFL